MELNATIFVQIFIFMTLLLWLSHALFAPILALFEEREKRIGGAKREAQELITLADEKAKHFDLEYEKARLEARHTLSSLKLEADKEQGVLIAQVRQDAKEKLERADQELAQEESLIRGQLGAVSEAVSADIIKALMTQKA